MAKSRMLLLILLAHFVKSALLIDVTQITVYPKHGSVSGVFQASLSTVYTFNASVARDVCDQLGVTMADKKQLERALKNGFETCRFGWIDEQVAVIPRSSPKASCGQGKVGLITWRAALSAPFDVFCFNSTDYEASMKTVQENPSTAVTPTARTSGTHPKLTKTTRVASQDDLQSTSSSLPDPEDDMSESQAFRDASPSTAVSLIALLTTAFVFLLLAMGAVCYFKKNSVGRWNKDQQKESIEAEVKNQHDTTSNAYEFSVTIKPENEDGAPS